eukprot:8889438-Heterocapsa_arctica.AAC.1
MRRMISGSRSCAPPEGRDVEGLMAGGGVSGRCGARSMGSAGGIGARGREWLGWADPDRSFAGRLRGELERCFATWPPSFELASCI